MPALPYGGRDAVLFIGGGSQGEGSVLHPQEGADRQIVSLVAGHHVLNFTDELGNS
jgi:hypothetical protein